MNTTKNKERLCFSFKTRLFLTLFLSLTVSLTLCLFGPLDIYLNNVKEFSFSIINFLPVCILYTLILSSVIFLALIFLKGMAFNITYAVFFAVGLMLFIQGNYLNFGLNSLKGDGVGADEKLSTVIINTLIWAVVIIAAIITVILIKNKHKEIFKTAVTIAAIAVILMQTVPLLVNTLTIDTSKEASNNPSYLTYKNVNTVSSGENIFYFVVDRFDREFYTENAKIEAPEIFSELDGFTYFDDMLSLYPRTYPSVPYMLSGIEHDFLDDRIDYLNKAYSTSKMLNTLNEHGYDVNLYTDTYYAYDTADPMSAYVKNAEVSSDFHVNNHFMLSFDMVKLSLYRYFPYIAKSTVDDISTPDFNKYIDYNTGTPKYTTDMKDLYTYISENELTKVESKGNFSFIHIAGCHMPNLYDENFNDADQDDEYNVTVSLKQSFKIINEYIRYLKSEGLYDDATIIISGDHGWHGGSDTETPLLRPHVTSLFFKPKGSYGTPMKTSYAPVAQGDVIPTIFESIGIEHEEKTLFDFNDNDIRDRKYIWQSLQTVHGKIDYELFEYRVTGKASDLNNWTVVDSYYVGDIYD